jgi:toxin YhaV
VKVNGWTLLSYPAFTDLFNKLTADVEHIRRTQPSDHATHPKTKLLYRLTKIVFEDVPSDPASSSYRLGKTLGKEYKHWKRAKFQRYRLFFRYDDMDKTIVFVWLNNDSQMRKAGDKNDPYAIFKKMLDAENPPDDWDALRKRCVDLTAPTKS